MAVTSCGVFYKNPTSDPAKTSRIKNSHESSGIYTWKRIRIEAIDFKAINYLTSWTEQSKKMIVNAGKHSVMIRGDFNRKFNDTGPYSSLCLITMSFVPGSNYQVKGQVEDSVMKMWIEDVSSGKPSSEVVKVPYQRMYQAPYIPVYVPPVR
ncbi:MAG: hypothetical protein ABL974_14110 [Prosthecobacter sp.]